MDICNDVMIDLATHRHQTPRADEALAYVQRAIDNQVLDTFRALARQCRDFRRQDSSPIEQSRLAAHQATASQVALRREIIEKIRSQLAPDDAKALDLLLANHQWKEIGEILGVKPDTIRMRFRRVIEDIQQQMAPPG